MPKRAWLTPDSLPTTFRCVRVLVPDSLELEAVFRGALLNLTYAYNWEQVGAATAEDTAELFWQGIQTSLEMRSCCMIGAIMYYPSDTIPYGLLRCNGQLVAVADYPELYAVIGNRYGGTVTHFNLPQLGGKFLTGSGVTYTLDQQGGQDTVSLSEGQLATHSHPLPMTTFLAAPGAVPVLAFNAVPFFNTRTSGNGDSIENRPAYQALVPVMVAK